MKLFYRKLGEGPALVILHGLYGSSDNWLTIGRILSSHFEVLLPDLRNHGQSPKSKEHSYDLMANDLHELINDLNLDKVILMGHSMGGKVAMQFAFQYPEWISRLIVLDITPKSYLFSLEIDSDTLNHKKIMEFMLNFDLTLYSNREQLDFAFSQYIKNDQIRQFLLKNISRDSAKNFVWKINLKALYSNINLIMDSIQAQPNGAESEKTEFPVAFVKGENSSYITDEDETDIKRIFPNSKLFTINGAGHWLHVDQPDLFLKLIYILLNIAK